MLTDFALLAPSAAPENIKGYSSSSTAIRVTWNAPPAVDQNGIIILYNVSYQSVGGSYSGSTNRCKQVAGDSTQTDLTGLEVYVLYNITVSASTSAGEGPSSIIIGVRTAETGKICKCNMRSIFGMIIKMMLFLNTHFHIKINCNVFTFRIRKTLNFTHFF